ncbi:thiol peroxidase [Thermithiobacillus plumbiphilus]|uniref:Thiol peroxidase n=1 Tax=Thermithiobacillus plumbiphilus TaxID=1729899 RepID=A0ABU9D577_9PROT
MQERANEVTLQGTPITLLGPALQVGDVAPVFTARSGLEDISSDRWAGRPRLISSVPSLDTPVCAKQAARFNEAVSDLDVAVIVISQDLPFAQTRFREVNGMRNVTFLSDYKDNDFGYKYGVYIKEHGLDHRAVFVIDAGDRISYVEYVPELTQHPNYAAALDAVKKLL